MNQKIDVLWTGPVHRAHYDPALHCYYVAATMPNGFHHRLASKRRAFATFREAQREAYHRNQMDREANAEIDRY